MTIKPALLLLAAALVLAGLASGCRTLLEGEGTWARVEVVFRDPPPEMLLPDHATFCHVGINNALFIVFKELPGSGVNPEVIKVDASAPWTGIFSAQTNTCVIQTFMQWRLGSRYHAIATDASGWLTRCEQSLQFFAAPPARHLIRFTFDQEGCETGLTQ